jgi:hypothetical protein
LFEHLSHDAGLEQRRGRLEHVEDFEPEPAHLRVFSWIEQAEAEACFHQAIEIARRQEAKSLERRAVVSLSRLRQRQGKGTEARRMWADLYYGLMLRREVESRSLDFSSSRRDA